MSWYEEWFNEDYLALYPHRSQEEAEVQVAALVDKLEPGPEILDLCCGAGRHSLALYRRGYQVTGLDLSPTLLAHARERIPQVPFIEQDMRSLSNLDPFDLVANFFTSFGYFSDADNQKVLQEVHSILKPGGQFLLDTLHPAGLSPIPFEQKGDVTIERIKTSTHAIKRISYPDRDYEERVRLYARDELEAMLKDAGFTIESVYNDFAFNPWHPRGERQIFWCTK